MASQTRTNLFTTFTNWNVFTTFIKVQHNLSSKDSLKLATKLCSKAFTTNYAKTFQSISPA